VAPAPKPGASKGAPAKPAVKKLPPLASKPAPPRGTAAKPGLPPPAPPKRKPAGKPSGAADLMNRGLQMARTGAVAPAKPGKGREKRINFSAMTTDERFYVRAWVQKIERVGNLNFPEAAKRLNRSLGPTLDVAVRADGSVQSIRVARSSGHQALDKAARQIVELAAPFAPFPEALRREYDILHIVRRWKFDHGRLSGQ
jgi:protein TonB